MDSIPERDGPKYSVAHAILFTVQRIQKSEHIFAQNVHKKCILRTIHVNAIHEM